MKRYRRAVPAVLALVLVLPASSHAQQGSPGSFSLPPGPQAEPQPPSDVQGPVDSESTPPRRAEQPAEPAPEPVVPSIAPVPVPVPQPRQEPPPRQPSTSEQQRTERQAPSRAQQQPGSQTEPAPAEQEPSADAAPVLPPVTPPPLPLPDTSAVPAPTTEAEAPDGETDSSIWWWLGAGLVALISLIVMGLRQRSARQSRSAPAPAPQVSTQTVPTPPLRKPPAVPQAAPPAPPAAPPAAAANAANAAAGPASSIPFGTIQATGLSFKPAASPAPAPSPATAPTPAPAPPPAPQPTPAPQPAAPQAAASAGPQPPRLLLDFTTLGVDVTLVNAIARYHLGITNMAEIAVSDVVLHGAVVQARRGMPPTIDPMQGDTLLPMLQKLEDIAPDGTRRCEGQIRLPLEQIEPIEMQGRLLFVPVVHIWIGYSGPDGTRYAVTQSFVLGEESSPPGARVGPLRLDLGPRRFTEVGQRPLQPA
ncbi:hypothetical protein [Blastomonas sp.]|uniref:hypothetical protein n=1 Tax=Blastomonas sp. TaxID=1909299 RepID=UPI002625642F|nr:hypothetical protein [Blastomonas sp.]MDM7956728.1 hypothetical protein [Blastomonas sp.]